jgi:hypothetical protein
VREIAGGVVLLMMCACTLGSGGVGSAGEKPPPVAAPAAAAPTPVPAPPDANIGQEIRGFRAFCDSWMQKLRDRETYNTAHIAWEKRAGSVVGEHVAYSRECTCTAREEPGKDPIGKITYRETRYRREGATPAEALAAPGTIVEHSDVTEIFRFAKGRWQY